MTIDELRLALDRLSDAKFQALVAEFGGSHPDRAAVVRAFVDHPEFERRLCQLLDLRTEHEKATLAAERSAQASRNAAQAAWIAVLIALVSAIVTAAGLLWKR
jgi:adenylosuccinate lyase